mgnify:FL=1
MTITTQGFRKRMAELMQSSLNEGELSIRVVDIVARRKHFWQKVSTSVTLELGITDTKTGEPLVHIETITIADGDTLKLKDINSAFTIKFL